MSLPSFQKFKKFEKFKMFENEPSRIPDVFFFEFRVFSFWFIVLSFDLERELPGCPVRWLTRERLRLAWSARVDDSSCRGALPPEDNCWIRCWAAANTCSGDPCRCPACTALFSRLTNLASNSSVVDMMYCRGSTLKNQELRYHARSKDSEGTASCACNTGRDNKRGQAQNMDDVETLFSLTDADGCREMKCQRVP